MDASSAALIRDVLSWYWRLGGVVLSCSVSGSSSTLTDIRIASRMIFTTTVSSATAWRDSSMR